MCFSMLHIMFIDPVHIKHSFPSLAACDKLVLDDKTLKKKKTCHELYKLQDGDSRPENVITLTARMKKKEREEIRKSKLF